MDSHDNRMWRRRLVSGPELRIHMKSEGAPGSPGARLRFFKGPCWNDSSSPQAAIQLWTIAAKLAWEIICQRSPFQWNVEMRGIGSLGTHTPSICSLTMTVYRITRTSPTCRPATSKISYASTRAGASLEKSWPSAGPSGETKRERPPKNGGRSRSANAIPRPYDAAFSASRAPMSSALLARARSKRSRCITLAQAFTKSRTNFACASACA